MSNQILNLLASPPWHSLIGSHKCGSPLATGRPCCNAGPQPGGMPRSVKDVPQPFSWTGLYIGIHAGLVTGETTGEVGLGATARTIPSTGRSMADRLATSTHPDGPCSGLRPLGRAPMFKAIGPASWCSMQARHQRDREHRWTVGLGGRPLVALCQGVAWGDVDIPVRIALLRGSDTQTGWTAGFGFEHALAERISIGIEYAHIDLGSETQNLKFTGCIVPAISRQSRHSHEHASTGREPKADKLNDTTAQNESRGGKSLPGLLRRSAATDGPIDDIRLDDPPWSVLPH
jgi:opacity protein-like surface antigen